MWLLQLKFSLSSLRLMSGHPVSPRCPTLLSFPDVSAVDDIRVLGQTEFTIQVDWKNPLAQVDHFRLRHTDPAGQEEELNVQRSQEARTKYTIVGKWFNRGKKCLSKHEPLKTNEVPE